MGAVIPCPDLAHFAVRPVARLVSLSKLLANTCTVCRHPDLAAINEALLDRVPLRTMADRWSVSKSALIRHRKAHISTALLAAKAASEAVQGDNLLTQVHSIVERAKEIVDEAQLDGDRRTALAALREVRGSLELLGKLSAASREVPQVRIETTTEWLALRSLIRQALRPYPDAERAFAELVLNAKEASGSFPRA